MKKLVILLLFFAVIGITGVAQAVDKTIEWDPVDGAVGYRISTSVDAGATWQPAELNGVAVGDILAGTTQIVATMSDTGLTLIRAASYNNIGEAIGTTSGGLV